MRSGSGCLNAGLDGAEFDLFSSAGVTGVAGAIGREISWRKVKRRIAELTLKWPSGPSSFSQMTSSGTLGV